MSSETTFKSKVAAWYYALVVFVVVSFGFGFYAEGMTGDGAGLTMLIFTAAVTIGLLLWLSLTTDYAVTHDMLLVRCGPVTWKIPRNEIQDIRPTRSVISSPGMSLDRLAVHWGNNKRIMVSPLEQSAFLRAMDFPPADAVPQDSP